MRIIDFDASNIQEDVVNKVHEVLEFKELVKYDRLRPWFDKFITKLERSRMIVSLLNVDLIDEETLGIAIKKCDLKEHWRSLMWQLYEKG